MKQVVRRAADAKGRIRVEDMPVPIPADWEVVIRTSFSVISRGTEQSTLRKTLPSLVRDAIRDPWTRAAAQNVLASGSPADLVDRVHDELIAFREIGYSGSGEVLEVGSDVAGLSPGQHVAFSTPGHAEVVCASRNRCVAIPSGLPLDQAAFGTLGAIAVQAIRRSEAELGDTVVIVGLGLLGQLVAQVARAVGATTVGIEPIARRRERALSLGLHTAIDPTSTSSGEQIRRLTAGRGADRVLVCASGSDAAIANQALHMCRENGRVTMVGLVPMNLERMSMFRNELDFVFSRSSGPGVFDPAWESGRSEYPQNLVRWSSKTNIEVFLGLLADQRIRLEELISARYPVSESQLAFDRCSRADSFATLLEYPQTNEWEKPSPATSVQIDHPGARRAADSRVAIGLIGCGRFARSVLLPLLGKRTDTRIRAIAARTALNSKPMAKKYRADYVTTDVDELLQDASITAVMIATRHDLHARLILAALEAGKHVFVEKPLALSLDDANRAVDVAARHGLHLQVGYNRRFAPLVERLLAYRTPGPTISLYTVLLRPLPSDHWTLDPVEGGGRILGESDHFFDLLGLVSRSRPQVVTARAITNDRQPAAASCRFSVQIEYRNGSLATLVYTDDGGSAFPRERLEVFGQGRVLQLEDFRRAYSITKKRKRIRGTSGKGHREELDDFFRRVARGGAAPTSIEARNRLLDPTRVARAAVTSIREARRVELTEL